MPEKSNTPVSCTAQVGRGESGDYALRITDHPAWDSRFTTALSRAASPGRFAVYLRAADHDPDYAARLYLWDRNLASSLLRDVAVIEVALRNALDDQLTSFLGDRWYDTPLISADRRLHSAKKRAEEELHRSGKPRDTDHLVAQLSLGFWVNLLDARSGEQLWRTSLHQAFPGARMQARAVGARAQRSWVLGQLRIMRFLRNRCAHHEPLLQGVPLPGQSSRVAVADAIAAYLRITRMLDRNLADWMAIDSQASATLNGRPNPPQANR